MSFLNSIKTTEKKVENTSNTIKLLINEIFKKNTIFYLANNKYRIYDINIENINTTPIKNTYNSKISLVMVHAYKDQKGTDIKMDCKLRRQKIIKLINKTFKVNYDIGNTNIYRQPYYKYMKKQTRKKNLLKKQQPTRKVINKIQ